jgi:hypothetical protein
VLSPPPLASQLTPRRPDVCIEGIILNKSLCRLTPSLQGKEPADRSEKVTRAFFSYTSTKSHLISGPGGDGRVAPWLSIVQ